MITLEEMLSSSVHLGHQVRQWNPKMSPYIYGERNGVHIIDLLQTLVCLEKSCSFLREERKKGKNFLIVSTKRQFASLIESFAVRCNVYYVTQRWLGGMLTNWKTIKGCINEFQRLEKEEIEGTVNSFTKKEGLILKKKKAHFKRYFTGIKNMSVLPDVVVIIGQISELNAVKECLKLGITMVTVVDTNCDPTITDFMVPANDDSVSSISLILNAFSNALLTKD